MYSIEIEDADGEVYIYGETFECLIAARKAARRLEAEDAEVESAVVVNTETGEEA